MLAREPNGASRPLPVAQQRVGLPVESELRLPRCRRRSPPCAHRIVLQPHKQPQERPINIKSAGQPRSKKRAATIAAVGEVPPTPHHGARRRGRGRELWQEQRRPVATTIDWSWRRRRTETTCSRPLHSAAQPLRRRRRVYVSARARCAPRRAQSESHRACPAASPATHPARRVVAGSRRYREQRVESVR